MIDSKNLVEILENISDKIIENKMFLNDLDTAIGDGDHGINMARGFLQVKEKLKTTENDEISNILNNVAMTLVSAVGGASGPLYGTAFMKMAAAMKEKTEINANDFLAMLKAAMEGIQMRGKAIEGEKTMLDALMPACNAYEATLATHSPCKQALSQAYDAALAGVEYTKTIKATKGRASYLGDRSIGHADPGASSTTLILEAVKESLS